MLHLKNYLIFSRSPPNLYHFYRINGIFLVPKQISSKREREKNVGDNFKAEFVIDFDFHSTVCQIYFTHGKAIIRIKG